MKQHRLFLLHLFFLCFLCPHKSFGKIVSFEDGLPQEWSTSKGKIYISDRKTKLGKNALCWEWQSDATLSLSNQEQIKNASSSTTGGISLWIYNTQPTDAPLVIRFKNNNGTQCSTKFNLNFTGWRYLLTDFRNDMGLPTAAKGTLHTMEIVAPALGGGTLYFDFLEFQQKINWERMSDFQVCVNENKGTDSYLIPRLALELKKTPPTENERQAFETITERINNWYTGTEKYRENAIYQLRDKSLLSYISKGVNNCPNINHNGTVGSSGLFPQNFYGTSAEGIPLATFRSINENCLLQLAYDYRVNGNQESLEKLRTLYDWFSDQGWADGSALGTLRFEMLRSAGFHHSLMLVFNKLENKKNTLLQTQGWLSRFGDVCQEMSQPGELADYMRTLAMPKLFFALNQPDEAQKTYALKLFARYMDNALAIAPGYLGSLKEDGSGYHHRGPYLNAYYPEVLYASTLIYYLLHDTPFKLSDTTFDNLKKALLSFRFFCAQYNVPGSITGRFPTQTEILQQLLPAFAYLIESSDDNDLRAAFKRLWNPDNEIVKDYIRKCRTDICFATTPGEVELMLSASENNVSPEMNPQGSRYMPYAGLLTVRNKDWTISVKGFSKYIWDYESSATENPYGRYQSYGQTEFTDLVNDNRAYDINKQDANGSSDWDWRFLSGTTTPYISIEDLNFSSVNKHRNFSDETFLGGIGLDSMNACFTVRLHDRQITGTFYADKSVFVAGNEILCLGSGIKGTPVSVTTLFQHKSNGTPVLVNGKETGDQQTQQQPILRDNFGNYFIVHAGTVTVENTHTTHKAYITHNNTDCTYAYSWLIRPSEGQIADYQAQTGWKILVQDENGHAAYHTETRTLVASLFKGNSSMKDQGIIAANKPMIILRKEIGADGLLFSITDPDMNRPGANSNDDLSDEVAQHPGISSEIWVEIAGIYEAENNPEEVKVDHTNQNTTIIRVQEACNGRAYRVKLKKTGQTSLDGLAHDKRILVKEDKVYIRQESDRKQPWILSTSAGVILKKGTDPVIELNELSKGIYLLRVEGVIKNEILKIRR